MIFSTTFEKWVEIIANVVKTLAILVGGLWVYYLFVRHRKNHPLPSFNVDLSFVGVHKGQWLTEVAALIENKGLVEHIISDFGFEVLCLRESDELQTSKKKGRPQTLIPYVVSKGYWITGTTVIDPGVLARYPFVLALPSEARFVRVKGEFKWADGTIHKASRLFHVPLPEGLYTAQLKPDACKRAEEDQ